MRAVKSEIAAAQDDGGHQVAVPLALLMEEGVDSGCEPAAQRHERLSSHRQRRQRMLTGARR